MTAAGYQALREGTGLLDLNGRGRFRARGEDRARLLHAMTTNHVQQLKPGESCYAFFLNEKGRILGDADILCLDDHFLLDTEPEAHDSLFQHLDKYIIMDDVTLEDARADLSVIAVEGPKSGENLARAGVPLPGAERGHVGWGGCRVAWLTSTGAPGYRIYGPQAEVANLRQRLIAAGAIEADAEAQRVVRLEHHKPRYGDEITDRFLLQETQQLQAVHFSKGCYLGQEIVERVRSRGQVHRLLVPLRIHSAEAPAKGTHLKAGESDAGEIVSAAVSPALGAVVAMAYVRADRAQPGTHLLAGSAEAEVLAP